MNAKLSLQESRYPLVGAPKADFNQRFADVVPYWRSLSQQEQEDLLILDVDFLREQAHNLKASDACTDPGVIHHDANFPISGSNMSFMTIFPADFLSQILLLLTHCGL